MKRANIVKLAVVVVLVLGAALAAYITMTPEKKPAVTDKKAQVAERQRTHSRKGRKSSEVEVAQSETAEQIEEQKRVEPKFEFDAEEEAKLTAEQKKLLAELRAAADEENLKKVRDIVAKIQALGLDKVPDFMQREAIDALGWFDSKTIPELFGFLGSPIDEVVEAASDELLSALDDISLSDREISDILINLAKVVTDEDTLDDIFMSFDDLRPSVFVKTAKAIWSTGTDVAKKLLPEAIEDFTDIDSVTSTKQLDDWLQANPDDEDDGDLFDGDKDDDDDKTDDDDDDQG